MIIEVAKSGNDLCVLRTSVNTVLVPLTAPAAFTLPLQSTVKALERALFEDPLPIISALVESPILYLPIAV